MSIKSEDFRTTIGGHLLTIKDTAEAEQAIIAYVQRQAFPVEIASLVLVPPRSSNLCRLDPVLDKGIMRFIDDEGLQTMFCEAEAILNSRPLSTVSSDLYDLEPLTFNHILLLKSMPILPPGTFLKSDFYARR
ncbi:hypothetical protein SRHO_G00319500 [Serrasalmus rhombeus]